MQKHVQSMSMFTMIEKISVLSGHGRNGRPEPFGRIDMTMGQVMSLVGRAAPARHHL
jgi:hypothetical protein